MLAHLLVSEAPFPQLKRITFLIVCVWVLMISLLPVGSTLNGGDDQEVLSDLSCAIVPSNDTFHNTVVVSDHSGEVSKYYSLGTESQRYVYNPIPLSSCNPSPPGNHYMQKQGNGSEFVLQSPDFRGRSAYGASFDIFQMENGGMKYNQTYIFGTIKEQVGDMERFSFEDLTDGVVSLYRYNGTTNLYEFVFYNIFNGDLLHFGIPDLQYNQYSYLNGSLSLSVSQMRSLYWDTPTQEVLLGFRGKLNSSLQMEELLIRYDPKEGILREVSEIQVDDFYSSYDQVGYGDLMYLNSGGLIYQLNRSSGISVALDPQQEELAVEDRRLEDMVYNFGEDVYTYDKDSQVLSHYRQGSLINQSVQIALVTMTEEFLVQSMQIVVDTPLSTASQMVPETVYTTSFLTWTKNRTHQTTLIIDHVSTEDVALGVFWLASVMLLIPVLIHKRNG